MRTYVHMYIVLINSYQRYFKFKLVQQPQIKKQKTTTTTGQKLGRQEGNGLYNINYGFKAPQRVRVNRDISSGMRVNDSRFKY